MQKVNCLLTNTIQKTTRSISGTVLLILLSMNLHAQSRADIIGNWSVQKVELSEEISLTEKQKEQMELLFFELKKSTFSFHQEQKASIYLTMADTVQNHCYWAYDDKTKIITLTDLKNKEAVRAKILVEISKDKEVKFHIAETPFILIVGK
jgi:hypothetical protein